MPSNLTIHLIRHGESQANVDRTVNSRLPDHRIPLSDLGRRQGLETGARLARILSEDETGGLGIYVSPYLRTRQTWDGIKVGIAHTENGETLLKRIRIEKESIHLRELEFGLFDGVPDEDLAATFPREHALYEKYKAFEGEFYARMPSGESRCDVAQRVHQSFGTLLRDHERHDVAQAVVISHGVTTRAFAMMWRGLPVEWMEAEPNPGNCSIRSIRGKDWVAGSRDGYLHGGPHHARVEVGRHGKTAWSRRWTGAVRGATRGGTSAKSVAVP